MSPSERESLIGQRAGRYKGWPKTCHESWIGSLEKWIAAGEGKSISHETLKAMLHSHRCNLAYIEELEELVND